MCSTKLNLINFVMVEWRVQGWLHWKVGALVQEQQPRCKEESLRDEDGVKISHHFKQPGPKRSRIKSISRLQHMGIKVLSSTIPYIPRLFIVLLNLHSSSKALELEMPKDAK